MNTLTSWIERKLAERQTDPWHECEFCGDIDTTHEALSTGEVVCWKCARDAGEYDPPRIPGWPVTELV
jgi:hypothetical protein